MSALRGLLVAVAQPEPLVPVAIRKTGGTSCAFASWRRSGQSQSAGSAVLPDLVKFTTGLADGGAVGRRCRVAGRTRLLPQLAAPPWRAARIRGGAAPARRAGARA